MGWPNENCFFWHCQIFGYWCQFFHLHFWLQGHFFCTKLLQNKMILKRVTKTKKTKVKLALRNGRVGGWQSMSRQVATRQTRQPSTRTRQFWWKIDRLICGHLLYQKNFLNFLAKKIEKIKKKKKNIKNAIFWAFFGLKVANPTH